MDWWHSYEVTNKVLFKYAPTLLVVKLSKKQTKTGTWAAGYSNPNLVRRKGSRIFPMQTRLYGWFSLVYVWGGHINNVMYPSGFNVIYRVHCTKAEMCGVDSPLDTFDIEVRVAPNMAAVAEKTQQQQQNEKRTNVNMQVQEVSRGWRWDQENFLTALADQWFQLKWCQHVTSRACATGWFIVPHAAPLLGRYYTAPALLHKSCLGNHGFLYAGWASTCQPPHSLHKTTQTQILLL